jgi:6-phosphogluconolactonase
LAQNQAKLLDCVHYFWGHERCVPPGDPESNFALAWNSLLRPLAVPDSRIHRIQGEKPPELAATEAETELCQVAPAGPSGQPLIDLVFLGMGEDGHVASLFPGEPEEVMTSGRVFRPVIGPKPPPRRITLGYRAISEARDVWIMVSGRGKEQVFRTSLSGAGATPIARVLRSRQRTKIFTDLQ